MKDTQNKNTQHIETQKNNPIILIMGGLLLLLILVFFISSLFSEKTVGLQSTTQQKEDTPLVSTLVSKNVQEVKLSWGKFNYDPEIFYNK